jgi:hypothetical protein
VKRVERKNTWGWHPANGGFAPERFPAFTVELTDLREFEGPGNLSSTDYRLVASDGEVSAEIECSNRSGVTRFEFRGQTYAIQVYDSEDDIGFSFTVYPDVPQQGPPLPWLPFDLDGVRIDENTDLAALVARTLGGWTPLAARPYERETPGRWALKLWSSLVDTGLKDEVERAADTCLRGTDAAARAAALAFFEAVPLRAWRARLPRYDASGAALPKARGFVVDDGPSATQVAPELLRELPVIARASLRDYVLVERAGNVTKKLSPTIWSDQEDLGATVFARDGGALCQLSVTIVYSEPVRVTRTEEVVAEGLVQVPIDDRKTIAFLRRALKRYRESLAEQRSHEDRAAAERIAAIPGARDDYGVGEDFGRAQSLLCARVGAYGDSIARELLAALARFGALHRSHRGLPASDDAMPDVFADALEAFVIACRMAAFDRSVQKRDLPPSHRGKAAGPKIPAAAEAEVRYVEAALKLLEHNLLQRAESQESSDANLNAMQYREAAGHVGRSRALLGEWLAAGRTAAGTALSLVDEHHAAVDAENAAALAEAEREAHATGKELFSLPRLEELYGEGSLADREESLKMHYYFLKREIRTLAVFARWLRKNELWE